MNQRHQTVFGIAELANRSDEKIVAFHVHIGCVPRKGRWVLCIRLRQETSGLRLKFDEVFERRFFSQRFDLRTIALSEYGIENFYRRGIDVQWCDGNRRRQGSLGRRRDLRNGGDKRFEFRYHFFVEAFDAVQLVHTLHRLVRGAIGLGLACSKG